MISQAHVRVRTRNCIYAQGFLPTQLPRELMLLVLIKATTKGAQIRILTPLAFKIFGRSKQPLPSLQIRAMDFFIRHIFLASSSF
jgi:hypothetical protein